jgi:hypothetical protein
VTISSRLFVVNFWKDSVVSQSSDKRKHGTANIPVLTLHTAGAGNKARERRSGELGVRAAVKTRQGSGCGFCVIFCSEEISAVLDPQSALIRIDHTDQADLSLTKIVKFLKLHSIPFNFRLPRYVFRMCYQLK